MSPGWGFIYSLQETHLKLEISRLPCSFAAGSWNTRGMPGARVGNGPDSQAGVRVTVYDGYPVGCWYPFANYPGTRE